MRVRHLLGLWLSCETFNRSVQLIVSSLGREGEFLDKRRHGRLFWTRTLFLQGFLSHLRGHCEQIGMNVLIDSLFVFTRWLQSANRAATNLETDVCQLCTVLKLLLSLLNDNLGLNLLIHQPEFFI